MTILSITLAPDGGLRLILPTGRPLDLGDEPSALAFIKRILRNAAAHEKNERKAHERGHIGEFPTQHVIEIWKREAKRAAIQAVREDFAAKGIDVAALDIQL